VEASEVLVAAAADLANLQNPLAEIAKSRRIRLRFVFGSSGMLARQIENGAPYDVYLSANERYVRELAASGHILPDTVRVYALGRVALWSREGRLKRLEELAAPSVRNVAMPNPAHAPYGVAAREALEKMGLWDRLRTKMVYGENVRQALQFAESGDADAVLTAWSLVINKGGTLVNGDLHAPIRQACGIVKGARNQDAARKFVELLTGAEGAALLRRWGLFPVE
jgi:molybdate transport system substrate-binding protein